MALFNDKIEIDLSRKDLFPYEPFKIEHIQQCKENWCWAATGSMLINFVLEDDSPITQFDFVRFLYSSMQDNNCIESDNEYNDPLLPEPFLSLLNEKGLMLFTTDFSDMETICEVLQESPVLLSISYNSNNNDGHFEILSGYDSERNLLYLNNPSKPFLKQITPEEFRNTHYDTNDYRARILLNSKLT